MSLYFSRNAFSRVLERLSLTPEEVKTILDEGRCLPIGSENIKREHILFYSEPDNFYFVAVFDVETGTIITILPVDYHNKWRVPESSLNMAKRLLKDSNASLVEVEKVHVDAPPSVFRLKCIYGNQKKKSLGSYLSESFGGDISKAVADKAFVAFVIAKIRKFSCINEINNIIISLGTKGDPVFFNIVKSKGDYILKEMEI